MICYFYFRKLLCKELIDWNKSFNYSPLIPCPILFKKSSIPFLNDIGRSVSLLWLGNLSIFSTGIIVKYKSSFDLFHRPKTYSSPGSITNFYLNVTVPACAGLSVWTLIFIDCKLKFYLLSLVVNLNCRTIVKIQMRHLDMVIHSKFWV